MANRWENKKLDNIDFNDVYYSRIIASWIVACKECGNNVTFGDNFEGWCKSIGLNVYQISELVNLATCGKMELEGSAIDFIERENAKHGLYNSVEAQIKYGTC